MSSHQQPRVDIYEVTFTSFWGLVQGYTFGVSHYQFTTHTNLEEMQIETAQTYYFSIYQIGKGSDK